MTNYEGQRVGNQVMNFCTKTDFTRNQTNQLSMNSFKENVVMHFWKLVVLFKGKQEESTTLSFLQKARAFLQSRSRPQTRTSACIGKRFSDSWSWRKIETFKQ
jgi:hypothetical protein